MINIVRLQTRALSSLYVPTYGYQHCLAFPFLTVPYNDRAYSGQGIAVGWGSSCACVKCASSSLNYTMSSTSMPKRCAARQDVYKLFYSLKNIVKWYQSHQYHDLTCRSLVSSTNWSWCWSIFSVNCFCVALAKNKHKPTGFKPLVC